MAKINPRGFLEWLPLVAVVSIVGVGAYLLIPVIQSAKDAANTLGKTVTTASSVGSDVVGSFKSLWDAASDAAIISDLSPNYTDSQAYKDGVIDAHGNLIN